MARTKTSKKAVLESLTDTIASSAAVAFASIQGLTVKESEDLRKAARAEQLTVKMAKKTLLSLAFKKNGYEEVDFKHLEGEVVATFSPTDEVAPARILAKFGKDHDRLKILGGLMMAAPAGSQYMDASSIVRLSKLPTREELLGKFVGTIAGPLRGLVGVLVGPQRSFVYALNAIADSKK